MISITKLGYYSILIHLPLQLIILILIGIIPINLILRTKHHLIQKVAKKVQGQKDSPNILYHNKGARRLQSKIPRTRSRHLNKLNKYLRLDAIGN